MAKRSTVGRSAAQVRKHAYILWLTTVVDLERHGSPAGQAAFYAGFDAAWTRRQETIDRCFARMREMSTRIRELESRD